LKYLEELTYGETFKIDNSYWLLTQDFKSNGKKLCYNLQSGYSKWFEGNTIVDINPIYALDKDGNIIPIKEYKNENSNIS
jgi:hypothetical protein